MAQPSHQESAGDGQEAHCCSKRAVAATNVMLGGEATVAGVSTVLARAGASSPV